MDIGVTIGEIKAYSTLAGEINPITLGFETPGYGADETSLQKVVTLFSPTVCQIVHIARCKYSGCA